MFGLFAFFYASLHALHYYGLDVQWNLDIIKEDLTTRRFFIAGMAHTTAGDMSTAQGGLTIGEWLGFMLADDPRWDDRLQ